MLNGAEQALALCLRLLRAADYLAAEGHKPAFGGELVEREVLLKRLKRRLVGAQFHAARWPAGRHGRLRDVHPFAEQRFFNLPDGTRRFVLGRAPKRQVFTMRNVDDGVEQCADGAVLLNEGPEIAVTIRFAPGPAGRPAKPGS